MFTQIITKIPSCTRSASIIRQGGNVFSYRSLLSLTSFKAPRSYVRAVISIEIYILDKLLLSGDELVDN